MTTTPDLFRCAIESIPLALAGGAVVALLTAPIPGCTAAQGRAVESVALKVGCALVAVFDPADKQIGTLCEDIAAAVEAEVAASSPPVASPLLGSHPHRRAERLRDHAPARDPGETIDEQHLPAALRVLARRGGGP